MAYVLVALTALIVGVMTHQARQSDFITLENEGFNWANSQNKWTVVNYFAEWCAPCLREIPELNHFYQLNKQNINMFAVSYDPLNELQLAELQKKYAIGFPIITSFQTMPWGKPPNSLPTTFILNPKGELIKQLKGEQSADELLQAIEILKGL
jgi:thiol-disulfide isomerase/thioredoxin